MNNHIIWQKSYHGFEATSDLERDISESLNSDYNDKVKDIPGEFQGTLKVTIEYIPEEDEE